ncbi:unnamed protein product [Prorocentrum cordatum]|uniref:Uncharacterized protein n=1 Tax=Prorocentrum cordatum TaxID=2364126 RepID=A0ABN9V461_9DINO|nr:unnamed protein product [Polarella glacialis]
MAIPPELQASLEVMFEKQKNCIREVVQQEIQTAVSGLQGQISTQGAELSALRADLQKQNQWQHDREHTDCAQLPVFVEQRSSVRQLHGDKARRVTPVIDPESDPCIRFVGTFPRPLLMKTRLAHWRQMQEHFPELEDDKRVTAVFHGVNQVYRLKVVNEDDATSFQPKMNDVNMEWVDFRDGKKYPLRKKRAFSGLYCDVLTKLQASRSWTGGCKLGVNGHKGILQVITDDDVYELAQAVQQGEGTFKLEPIYPSLLHLDITKDAIDGLIAAL